MSNTKKHISLLTLYQYLQYSHEDVLFLLPLIENAFCSKKKRKRFVDYQGHCFWRDAVKFVECKSSMLRAQQIKSLSASFELWQRQISRKLTNKPICMARYH